jgi:crotonobetainyl-CoA:carnitine CoA-transferase CaiB-like acyl-CoA transferase
MHVEQEDVLLSILKDSFASRAVGEWVDLLTARGVPCAPVNGLAEALADRQADARDALPAYEHPVLGDVRTVASPFRLSASSPPLERGPFLGEHTAEILAELCGYSRTRIRELAALGAFGDIETEEGSTVFEAGDV